MIAIGFTRRALLRGAWAVLVFGSAGGFVAQAQGAGPIAPIEQLQQALLTVMRQGRATPFGQRATALTPTIERAFDLPAILRVSVGPTWSRLSPEEQRRLLDVFRQYTVATYVQAFDHYDGQRFVVSPQTRSSFGGSQVVHTEIVPRSGETHTIDYVMRRAPDGAWKATDVLADGTISRVAVQRSDFSAMLASGGAPALVAGLQRKTAMLERS
ncbi:MAG: ABC transporter substrate-binding protein [Acetobacteraceae bacterium]|nr:ABC transporter substrate-binding protein [Acetobacteraceae bacterium]